MIGVKKMGCNNWRPDEFPKRLPAKEEALLFLRFKNGDEFARQVLITHNMRLVTYVVQKFSFCESDRDDIISCGMVGLMQAVDSYKADSGTRFSTFAVTCIKNEILKLHFRLKAKSSKDSSIEDIVFGDDLSLTIEDVIPDDSDIEDDVDMRLGHDTLLGIISSALSEEQGYIIKRRYGLVDGVEASRFEVAKELNITYSGVSHSEKRAVEKLKKAFWG